MEKQKYLLHSVKNAMKILHLFSLDKPELGVTEISSEIGISISSTHRLLSTLLKKGYLKQNKRNKKYSLGFSLLGLTGVIVETMEIHKESKPILNDLAEQLGETVYLNVLEGPEVVYIHKVESKHPFRFYAHIGKRNPAYCSSAGKVILAHQSKEVINSILQMELIPYTPNTVTDPEKLRKELTDIKNVGYSVAIEEFREGVVSIAVPVRDYTGEVIAAINLVGPKQRMLEDQFLRYNQHLQIAGRKLSRILGFTEKVNTK